MENDITKEEFNKRTSELFKDANPLMVAALIQKIKEDWLTGKITLRKALEILEKENPHKEK